MKNAFYFDHDYNARNDLKILELRAEFGWEGYGVYFALLESLCEAKGYIKREALAGLSVGLSLPLAKLNSIISLCLKIDLLQGDENYIFSERILKHLDFRQKLKIAGQRGGKAFKATLKPPLSHPQATLEPPPKQERKEKEKDKEKEIYKEKEKKEKKVLSIESRKQILREKALKFKEQLKQFEGVYPDDMLNAFYLYWVEPNKSYTAMRYELQKTWDLKLRLLRWSKNNYDGKNGSQVKETYRVEQA